MSLSVSNTGYSNSQAQSTAIRPAEQPATAAFSTDDSEHIVDPLTGKTLTAPNNIKISAQAMDLLIEQAKHAPSPTPISAEQQKEAEAQLLSQRNQIIKATTSTVDLAQNKYSDLSTDIIEWSNHLKADSGVSKEEFLGLAQQAVSSPPNVALWNYTTDSIEITLKAAKLEELKNRYVDSDYHQSADRDVQNFIQDQSTALSNLEKNILQDEYQRSVDSGNTQQANDVYLELQKNAQGTSTTQIQRQQIFSLSASSDNDTLFSHFRHYISSTAPDRYTESEQISILNQFHSHWMAFQLALK